MNKVYFDGIWVVEEEDGERHPIVFQREYGNALELSAIAKGEKTIILSDNSVRLVPFWSGYLACNLISLDLVTSTLKEAMGTITT